MSYSKRELPLGEWQGSIHFNSLQSILDLIRVVNEDGRYYASFLGAAWAAGGSKIARCHRSLRL